MSNSLKIKTGSESAQLAVPELPQRPQPSGVMRQYWKLLICGGLCGLVAGVAFAYTREKTYTCQSTLLFPAALPSSGLAALTGSGGGDPSLPLLQGALSAPQVGSNANTAILMMQSRRLEKQVIHKLKLWDHWKLDKYPKVIKQFEKNLRCSTGKSGELYVSFQDPSPELSYQITTEVISELKRLTTELRMDPAAGNVKFLEQKVNESKKQLAKAQGKFSAYQKRYKLLDLTSQGQDLAQRYADLQKDAAAAQLEANIADRQVKMLSSSAKQMVTSSIDPSPLTGNTLSPLYQKVKEAESQLALLKYQLTDDHPQVQEQKRILLQAKQLLQAETKRQLAVVGSGASPGLNPVAIQAAASKARAAGLKQAAANVAAEIDKLPSRAAAYLNLQAQVQGYVQAVTLYQQELEKARILTESRGPALIELDPPEPPLVPDPTHRTTIVFLATLFGIAVAAVFPYREWQRRVDIYEDSLYVLEENRLAARSLPTNELGRSEQ